MRSGGGGERGAARGCESGEQRGRRGTPPLYRDPSSCRDSPPFVAIPSFAVPPPLVIHSSVATRSLSRSPASRGRVVVVVALFPCGRVSLQPGS